MVGLRLDAGLWLLPSRRRPHNLSRFFSALRTTDTKSHGLVLVQEQDYAALKSQYDGLDMYPGWRFVLTQGDSQGDKLREQVSLYHDAEWVGLIGDDQEPVTPNWDAKLVASLNGYNLVTCTDDFVFEQGTKFGQPNRMAGVLLFSGELYRTLGYIFPPPIHHVYLDDIYEELATKVDFWTINRDVLILHHHARREPSRADDTDRVAYGGDGSFAALDHPHWLVWQREKCDIVAENIKKLKAKFE
jgi:hypothetical protein